MGHGDLVMVGQGTGGALRGIQEKVLEGFGESGQWVSGSLTPEELMH